MTFKSVSSLFFALIFLAACAHHRDVRPGVEGIHRVVLSSDNEAGEGREAMNQANHFCKERNRTAAVVSEKTKYVGSMDEDSYKAGKMASKVATGIGGAAAIFGGKNERRAGGVVGLGGVVADDVLGKAYQFEMKFKCI